MFFGILYVLSQHSLIAIQDQTLLSNSQSYDNGWKYSSWFGWYYEMGENWIYHAECGLIYLQDSGTNSIYIFDKIVGAWFWTSGSTFPYLFKFGNNSGWYWYYSGGSPNGRWYNRLNDSEAFNQLTINFPSSPAGFSYIPGGDILVGSPKTETGRNSNENLGNVTITRGYFIQQTEVTNGQMVDVMNWAINQGLARSSSTSVVNLNGTRYELLDLDDPDSQIFYMDGKLHVTEGKENLPCVEVSWYGALSYCNFLSGIEGLAESINMQYDLTIDLHKEGYRLPTEAEWEHACRALTRTAFHTGNLEYIGDYPIDPNLNITGWYLGNSYNLENEIMNGRGTFPPKGKAPNDWRVYDMHGNVSEWCIDSYSSYGPRTGLDPPRNYLNDASTNVIRGGSFIRPAEYCRSAFRGEGPPYNSYSSVGFRPVRISDKNYLPERSLVVLEGNFDFGTIQIGYKYKKSITLKNTGNWPMHVTGESEHQHSFGKTLYPEEEIDFDLTLNPVKTGNINDVLYLNHNAAFGVSEIPITATVIEHSLTPIEFSLVIAGSFTMGSPNTEIGYATDEREHEVILTRDFYIQTTEVTYGQWTDVRERSFGLGYNDLSVGINGVNGDVTKTHPVVEISWWDAVKWCNALSELEGLDPCYKVNGEVYRNGYSQPHCDFSTNGYRLPTEAEWEFACRAGTTTAIYSGELTNWESDPKLNTIAWYASNSGASTHRIKYKNPNSLGLFDMLGNVMEYCWDWWDYYYKLPTNIDPEGVIEGTHKSARGGSWKHHASMCKSASRVPLMPDSRNYNLGFRIAKTNTESN